MHADLAGLAVMGLVLGAAYALVAAGLSVIYGILGIVNFAHGELLLLGAYAGAFLLPICGGDFLLTAIAVLALGAGLGAGLYLGILRPLSRGGPIRPMVGTLGLSILIYNSAVYLSGILNHGQPVVYQVAPGQLLRFCGFALPASLSWFGWSFSPLRLVLAGLAVVLIAGLGLLLGGSQFGRALRATAWRRDTVPLLGIDPDRVSLWAVVFGTAVTCMAGTLIGGLLTVTPTLGVQQALKSFVVVICAGFGNVGATLAVGMLLGLVEAVAIELFGMQSQYPWIFGMVILLLLVRPTGLVAERVPEAL